MEGTPEQLGLEPVEGVEDDPSVTGGERRSILVFFAMEFFRGEYRILLEKSGSLPQLELPDIGGSVSFFKDNAEALFGSKVANVRQIGSITGTSHDAFVVTGDVLSPALVEEGGEFRSCFWCPRSEVVRFKTLQSMLIAFAQTGLTGWGVIDSGRASYEISFKMRYCTPEDVADPDPLDPHEKNRSGGPEFAAEKRSRLICEDVKDYVTENTQKETP